jgi:hypothetical protein
MLVEVPVEVGEELLPRELVWLDVVAPFAAAPVLDRDAFAGTLRDGDVSAVALPLPFDSLT